MANEQLKAKLKEAVDEYIETHMSYVRWAKAQLQEDIRKLQNLKT